MQVVSTTLPVVSGSWTMPCRMDAEGDLPQSDDLGERFPHSFHALAARLIIELEEDTFGDRSLSSPEFNPSRWTLQVLRPFLTGAIARDASELLARADDRLSATFNDWFGVRWHDADEGDGDDAEA
jgi:hypothetical protein